MKSRKTFEVSASLLALVTACAITGCSTEGANKPRATIQGTVPLETITVGVPEDTLKTAILTFWADTNPMASAGGKTQYNSRAYDPKGGQYIANCKNGKCFKLQAYYVNNPITKEEALETIKRLLPQGAPPQSKVDDAEVKAAKVAQPTETYYFGDYSGQLAYTDKSATKVSVVTVEAPIETVTEPTKTSSKDQPNPGQ